MEINYGMLLMVGVCLVLLGGIIYLNSPTEISQEEELTPTQLNKMVELGLIKINRDLSHNTNDEFTGVVYKTTQGECSLYQDILGRYYCRW